MRRRKTYKDAVTSKNDSSTFTSSKTIKPKNNTFSSGFTSTNKQLNKQQKKQTYRGSYPQKITTISYEKHQENLRLAKEAEEEKEEINISKLTVLTISDTSLQQKSSSKNNKNSSDQELDREYEQIDPKELVVENDWTIY